MLSIGKLGTGQANYYLRQAGGRIDHATSVASGVEDYYLDGAEPAGEWIGTGRASLGLSARVDGEPLHRVLAGEDPRSAEPLRDSARARVPGFDLTFSAPKSVSVLFGVADDDAKKAIQAAHDIAVRDALGYVERTCSHARRGHNGLEVIPGEGLVAAAFRHRTSRAGDPQLHTHVLIANLLRGSDGRWSALDGRRLYAHAKTAGYLYEARLRAELTVALGVEWTAVRNGIADVAGVPRPVLRAFSRRRQEIEAELVRHGTSSAAAAQAAALETRRAKNRLVDPRRLLPEWRERAAALGFDARELEEVLHRQSPPEVPPEELLALADELAGADGLTQHASSFSRRDVIRAWCEWLPPGAAVSAQRAEKLADRFLASPRAVALVGASRPPADIVRARRGGSPPLLRDELRYSTPELLAIEQRVVDAALCGADMRVGIAHPAVAEAALARRPYLTGEQQAMVRRLTLDAGQVVAVVGKAGTGKTTALAGARDAWVASGVTVVGAAVARRAAHELQESAGIPSTSLTALLNDLRRGGNYGFAPGTVVVLDEASMVGSRELYELVERVRAAGGKLVLCGDHRQLPSIRAGGAFRAVTARTDAIELTENRRQRDAWERGALDELRDGSAIEALRVYELHDRLVLGGDRAALMQRLVSDWWASRDTGQHVMIALRRVDVRELNERARSLMRADGRLGTDVHLACGTFALGDHIVLRRNDRRLGVANGELGVIAELDRSSSVTVDVAGRRVNLPASYLHAPGRTPALQHAYAVTGHVAQGMTVDRAFILGSADLYREWGYTAMSRGRHSNRLYVLDPDDLERREIAPRAHGLETAAESLNRGFTTSRAQVTAIDTALLQRIRATPTAVLRRRATAIRSIARGPAFAAALAEHERCAVQVEQTRRDINALERRVTSLSTGRPRLLRPVARSAHTAEERRLEALLAERRTELEFLVAAERRTAIALNRHRERAVVDAGDHRLEQALIDEELARRAANDRVAGRVRDGPG